MNFRLRTPGTACRVGQPGSKGLSRALTRLVLRFAAFYIDWEEPDLATRAPVIQARTHSIVVRDRYRPRNLCPS